MAKRGEKGIEYKLSVREQKFIAFYIESGDPGEAVRQAKFNTTSPVAYARKLLAKPKIQKELNAQLSLLKNDAIASAQEIMVFYTHAMRGEIKDQFGLDPTLADRMKAADALAKRQIDMQAIADKAKDNELTIKLSWNRNGEEEPPMKEVFDAVEDTLLDAGDDDEEDDDG